MSIQITIQPPSDSADPIEAHYDADTISIGRSPDARVHLADVNRIVSKRHAEIRRTNTGYALVDLGSKNFTFLDGERLEANQPRALEDGDTFTIGDYSLTVHLREPEEIPAWMESDSQETAFAADFRNPFEEPVSDVVEGLQQIAIAYEKMATTRRTDALQDALRGSDENTERLVTSDGLQELFEMLGLSDALAPARSDADSDDAPASHDRRNENEAGTDDENTATPSRQPARARPSASPQPSPLSPDSGPEDDFEPWTPQEASAQRPSASETGGDRDPGSDTDQPFIDPDALPNIPDVSYLDFGAGRAASPPSDQEPRSADRSSGEASVEDMKQELVRAVARLITIPWQFRHEFIGQTIMQSPDSAFLYGSPDSVYDDLLGDRISPAERARRIACLREAVDAVVKHQVAMLDGYKASVSSGGRELLDALDPNQVRERVQEENQLYEWIPMLSAPTVLDRLSEQHLELRRGAWSVAEHRVFRPAFIKAYLARMTSSDSHSERDAQPAASQTP